MIKLSNNRNLPAPALLGMVHVRALPGTPFYENNLDEVVKIAVDEAVAYKKAGFTGILLENMFDRPYLKCAVGPEITASMTRVACAVRQAVGNDYPIGIQILAGANVEALSVALVANLDFIRAEGCVFGHVADEGWIEACAGNLLRERARLGAKHIRIWTDLQKKHSAHAVTADLPLEDWVHGAEFFGIDGVIITGTATGVAAKATEVERASKASPLPVIVGSGITASNCADYAVADGWIVGSSIKQNGYWENPLDPKRLDELVAAHRAVLANKK